jgi:hypothetical protein
MNKIYSSFLIFLLTAWMISCKSASKLYEKGNYDEAVQVAVKKIQKDPNDAKLKSLVRDAYRYAVNDHEARIRDYAGNSSDLKWEWMYNEYVDLQRLYQAIYKSPVVFELVHPVDYSSYLTTYAAKAGDAHYQRGLDLMSRNDKTSFKNAYYEFQAALRFKPADIDVQQMLDESYEGALTRVIVMPADDYDFSFSSYRGQFSNFDNDIVRDLQYNPGNGFVKFFSSWDAQRLNIIPDEVLEMHFTHMNIGRIQDNRSTREVSKEVVVKETVYKPDSILKEYGRVKAKITTVKRTLLSEGNLNINIRDNTGRWIWNDNIRGSHGWSSEFSTYTGDERALSEDDKRLVNRRQENAPREDEIMKCIKDNIYNDFVSRIRNYYSRY